MKTVVKENQKGLLFKDGKLVEVLNAGSHFKPFHDVELLPVSAPISSKSCSLEYLINHVKVKDLITVAQVADNQIALHFVNGRFESPLARGKHAFWSDTDAHTFDYIDIDDAANPICIPSYILNKIPSSYYTKIEISEYQKGKLFADNKFITLLDAGTYCFWNCGISIKAELIDMRLHNDTISENRLMTLDKIPLNITLTVSCKITDPMKITEQVDKYVEHIHSACKVALGECVSTVTFDDLLKNMDKINENMLQKVKAKCSSIYMEITDAGITSVVAAK